MNCSLCACAAPAAASAAAPSTTAAGLLRCPNIATSSIGKRAPFGRGLEYRVITIGPPALPRKRLVREGPEAQLLLRTCHSLANPQGPTAGKNTISPAKGVHGRFGNRPAGAGTSAAGLD